MDSSISQLLEILKEPGAAGENLRRRLVEALLVSSRPVQMTYEEFLAWAGEDTLAEWANGEVIMVSPASKKHQQIAAFLYETIHSYCKIHMLGEVLISPFQMKLSNSGREPDLLFITERNLERLKESFLDGPADLVVEIISPESIGRDRGEKFAEYEQAAIPEYWLIDPETQRAEFYTLDPEGRYALALRSREGIFHSKVLAGFWLKIEWLWQEPLPGHEEVLLLIAGEAYAQYLLDRLANQGFFKQPSEEN